MERLDLRDFSGGISEQYAPEGFSERQWSKLKGFIIDTDYTLRSQWAGQSIGTREEREEGEPQVPLLASGNLTEVAAISGFRGNSNSYLVAMKTDGTLWWTFAPARDASFDDANLSIWYPLLLDKDNQVIVPEPYRRFVCEILLFDQTIGEVNALLLNATTSNENAIAIYENDNYTEGVSPITSRVKVKQWSRRYPKDKPNLIDPLVGENKSGSNATTIAESISAPAGTWTVIPTFTGNGTKWTIANDGIYPVEVRVNTGSTITTVQPLDSYTHTSALGSGQKLQVRAVAITGSSLVRVGITLGTYPLGMRNVMPRANVGTMWRNRLILGDIRKRLDPTKEWEATGNQKRAKYGLFYSEVEPDSFREQAILYAGSGESQIVGMHVLDDYLITVSSAETETDGLRLFRGTLDYLRLQNNEVTLNINVLRGGIGPSQESGIATENLNPSCVWPEAGVVVFLDSLGGVWYTDGVETDRLDKTGPTMPDVCTPFDEVAALGKYLFAWRDGRLLVLNILSGVRGETATAAWTELVLPEHETVRSFCPLDGSMYFVMDGQVWRFAMSRNNPSDTERACFDDLPYQLTVATATLSDQDKHSKINWFNYGMRSRKRSYGGVVKAVMYAGPALDPNSAKYEVELNRELQERDELVVKCGIGFRTEGSAEFTLYGDIQIESMSFWTSGIRMSRPEGGGGTTE